MCSCNEAMHLHESQTKSIPDDMEIAALCKGCGEPLVFPPGAFTKAFAQLRAEGWLE